VAVVAVKFWLGVVAAVISVGPGAAPYPGLVSETFVEQVKVPAEPWTFTPLPSDVDEHAQCLLDVLALFELDVTVDNLFVVGDFADLNGGPCGLLP
jgi:hypothetical protein